MEFATTDIFERTSYDLAADISGFATYQVFTSPPGGSAEVYYSTTRGHPGALTIEAVNVKDSVVTGTFVFDAVPLGPGSAVHHIAGQFRVRYVTTVP